MWIIISLITIFFHQISICPPPSTPPPPMALPQLSFSKLSTANNSDNFSLTSPREQSTRSYDTAPHQLTPSLISLNISQITLATPVKHTSSQPTSPHRSKKRMPYLRKICPCNSIDYSSDDEDRATPLLSISNQELPTLCTAHTPPTKRTYTPPRPIDTNTPILTTLATKNDTLEDLRLPASQASLATKPIEPTTTLTVDPSTISQIALHAVTWATEQLNHPVSNDYYHISTNDLRYTLKETYITPGIAKRTLLGFSKRLQTPQGAPVANIRAETIVATTPQPTPMEGQISLSLSFMGNITPQDLATTPLAPLLTYLHLHRSSLRCNIPIDNISSLNFEVDEKIIHCIMRKY